MATAQHPSSTNNNNNDRDDDDGEASSMDMYRVEILQDGHHMNVFMPSPLNLTEATKPTKRFRAGSNTTNTTTASSSSFQKTSEDKYDYIIPESVRQYERQLRKMQAATRASTPLSANQLQIIYNDPHIVVVNKPSGVLSVPGVHHNPNMLSLLYETLKAEVTVEKMEHMIVHRLDMDTSGLLIFAKTRDAMSKLQALFRRDPKLVTNVKEGGDVTTTIQKEYEAILCGHIQPLSLQTATIDLPLQKDHQCPPFMRVATPTSEIEAKQVVEGLKHAGWKKIIKKNAKPSQTLLRVLERDYLEHDNDGNEQQEQEEKLPITRVALTPVTGRTHQLRVHCAAIGHPIVGDPTYGILGEASPNGGLKAIPSSSSTTTTTELQMKIDQWTKNRKQVMCLHARKLSLPHPITGEDLNFDEPPKF